MKNLRQYMDAFYLPAPEEYRKIPIGTYNEKMAEVKNLYQEGMFTERFIMLQGAYRFLLSRFFISSRWNSYEIRKNSALQNSPPAAGCPAA